MQSKGQTSKEYFKSLTIIHAALLAGQVLFLAAILVNNVGKSPQDPDILLYIALALAFGGITGGILLENARLKSTRNKVDLKSKVSEYQKTLIMKFALLEGPSLFALVCYNLSANYIFLGLSGLLITIHLINKPSREKLIKDLGLNNEERSLVENPEAIISEIKVGR